MTAVLLRNEVAFLARTAAVRAMSVIVAASVGLLTFSRTLTPPPDAPALAAFPFAAVLLGTLALVVPWLVARQLSDERGPIVTELCAQAAVPPEHAATARVGASLVVLGHLYLLTLPIGLVAWESGRANSAAVLASLASLACLHVASVVLSHHACLLYGRRVSSWILATAGSVAVTLLYLALRARMGDAVTGGLLLACAAGLLAWLRQRARRHLFYLPA